MSSPDESGNTVTSRYGGGDFVLSSGYDGLNAMGYCTSRSLAPVRGLGRHKLLRAAVGRGTGTGVRVHGALDRELVLHGKQVIRLLGPFGVKS